MSADTTRTNRPAAREDGGDLIFLTGAPGSKWSPIGHALSFARDINVSDRAEHRSYEVDGAALHFGSYFGPGMEHGRHFDALDQIGKADLLSELSRPYSEAGGVKLLKSHMFARHLEHLCQLFPEARFVLVYRSDDDCLDWWTEAGGFDISFPDYSWYREVETMRAQIALDNAAILEFAERHGLRLARRRSLAPLLEALELELEPDRLGAAGAPEEVAAALHAQARLARIVAFRAADLPAVRP